MPLDASSRSFRIAYVLKVFPRLSETFVINEIRELERQGVAVQVFSLHAPPGAVPHRLLQSLEAPIVQVDTSESPSDEQVKAARALLRKRIAAGHHLTERLFP